MQIWIAGVHTDPANCREWGLCGVFDTREAAAACCLDCRYFIVAVPMNQALDLIKAERLACECPNMAPAGAALVLTA